uniref:PNT domain-containing protein n=1 Tax=Sus scrofa TaxID=9823 RepID=A0A8D0VV54_PIG
MQITWGQEPSLKARKSPRPMSHQLRLPQAPIKVWAGGAQMLVLRAPGAQPEPLRTTTWQSLSPDSSRLLSPNLPATPSAATGSLMAATCEISNVFSNYFSTMYSSEDPTLASVPAAATFGADDLVLALGSPQMPLEGPEKASWSGEQPQLWSKAQVLDWISYQVEKHKYDASTIDLSRCDMDGAALCRCAPEELRLVFGPLGDQLYAQLWDLTSSFPDELSWIMELLEKDSMTLQEPLGDQGPFDQGSPFAQEMLEDCRQPSPFYPGSFSAGAPSPGSSDVSTAGTGASQSSPASDSGGSDVDLDAPDSKPFPGDGFPDYKKGDLKHGKRKRGRPRKLSKESRGCLEGTKSKHGEGGTCMVGRAEWWEGGLHGVCVGAHTIPPSCPHCSCA